MQLREDSLHLHALNFYNGRRQAIIWTDVGIVLIQSSGTNFRETVGKIHTFSFKKVHLNMSSAKFCLGIKV